LGVLAWIMWHLGYPDRALAYNDKLLTLAQELSSPYVLALALVFATTCHQCRRDVALTRERADAVITLSNDQGFPMTLAWGGVLRGWALTEEGKCAEGIVQLRKGVTDYRATGAKIWQSYFLALLAESLGKAGQAQEGLSVLAEAFALVEETGERIYEAELHRLQAELTLSSSGAGSQANAQACFENAIGIAHAQGSKSLELRARNSLARLWQQQGKNEEVRRLLAEIYGGFAEGFDTTDLREAKTLANLSG